MTADHVYGEIAIESMLLSLVMNGNKFLCLKKNAFEYIEKN